jgi:VIT1/CCC1 family predicted Fe2+/Mn2+ transporter
MIDDATSDRAAPPSAPHADHPHAPRGWAHGHRDVSGGWLRPTVFGAVDGLVTNAALIAGVGGSGASIHTVALTGIAGLVAGAFSMGTGEYVSVTNQNELVAAEVAVEAEMHARYPIAEQRELQERFRGYGADAETAQRMAAAVSADPETALQLHARDELGVDPQDLPSPVLAGSASLVAFSVGAVIPLLPYLLGVRAFVLSLVLAGVALLVGGGVVGRITGRSVVRAGVRQLLLGALAVAVTYAIGTAVGTSVG